LSARSYGGGEAVVLGISDPILPDNNGSWHLSPDGAKRTDAKADASVDISALSAAYLGGAKWWQLAMAGQVVAGDQDGLAALDNLFATAQAPFSGTMF
jgi:predicted acetyltransferase